jgi:DNA-binding Lrp family transcriptional regulator
MATEYILISTKNSFKREVSDKLSKIDGILDVEPLAVEETELADPFFEDYDLIAKMNVDSSNDIKNIIHKKIDTIPGIEKIKIFSN